MARSYLKLVTLAQHIDLIASFSGGLGGAIGVTNSPVGVGFTGDAVIASASEPTALLLFAGIGGLTDPCLELLPYGYTVLSSPPGFRSEEKTVS